jgi:hypothetical protein
LTEHGFREKEPYGIKREQSITWRKVFTELWKDKVTKKDVAQELSLPFEEVRNLLYGLEDQPERADNPTNARLRLIAG